MAALRPPSLLHDSFSTPSFSGFTNPFCDVPGTSLRTRSIFGSRKKPAKICETRFRSIGSDKSSSVLAIKASRDSVGFTQEIGNTKLESLADTDIGADPFDKIKQRFMNFKHNFLLNPQNFQNLAKGQAPKFMVIACADSRVCPSNILGFQPGESFTVRNVANLVPPFESGPCETNAALEFAVNSLEVENILVIGHSCCGGIHALMSMQDEEEVDSSSFIKNWVVIGKNARLSTKAATEHLNFDQQCTHCEKESINCSLTNLLTYPWIEERVRNGMLNIHGGYYDFRNCTFEKWTLDFKGSSFRAEGGGYSIKDGVFWC